MLSMVYVKLKTEVRVMRNGDAARAASGGGVAAPGHEPVEDDQLLRRGRLGVARHGGDKIQLPARQRPIALKAEVNRRSTRSTFHHTARPRLPRSENVRHDLRSVNHPAHA